MPEKLPIWLHPRGLWCKKYRGRLFYFGRDKDEALRRYVVEWPEISAGRPRPQPMAAPGERDVDVDYLCNAYLTLKRERVAAGEMAEASYYHVRRMTQRVIRVLGRHRPIADLGPDDYGRLRADAAAALGPRSLIHFLGLARGLFKFGATLTDRQPKYGDRFDPPPRRVVRLHRQTQGERLIPAEGIRAVLSACRPALRAMVLLGVNCAYGATDLAELRRRHVDARPGWLALPRRKTGVARRAPLWPETVAALEAAWLDRPRPADPRDADRVFLSPTGLPLVRFSRGEGAAVGGIKDGLNPIFLAACRAAGVPLPKRVGFYALRHVFRTVADELPDRAAVELVMGHTRTDQGGAYVERVGDARLQAVVDHVRAWLWPKAADAPEKPGRKAVRRKRR